MRARILLPCLLLAACGPSQPPDVPAAQSPPPAPSPSRPQPATTPAIPANSGLAFVRAMDLDGKPIAGLVPIVTTEQHAMNPPIATGIATDEKGIGTVPVPAGAMVYVRAWDPDLSVFPNNVYSVSLKEGEQSTVMDVQMIASGSLAAAVFGPDESPLANAAVRVMLEHPSQGPWWPASTTSDEDGVIVFEQVPAGRYILHVLDEDGHRWERADIEIQPEGITTLGKVVLQ